MNEIVENVFLVISVILLVAMIVCIYLGWFTEELSDEEIELRKRIKAMWILHDFMDNNRPDKMMLMKIKNEEKILVWFEDESVNVLELLGIEKIEYNVTRKNYKRKIKGFLRA